MTPNHVTLENESTHFTQHNMFVFKSLCYEVVILLKKSQSLSLSQYPNQTNNKTTQFQF